MKKPILFAIIGVVLLAVIGGALYFFVFAKKDPVPEPVVYLEYPMDERYTNIKDPKMILKFSMIIQYSDEALTPEFDKNKTKINNNVLQYFRTKSAEQLNAVNGQERAREDILEMIIEVMGSDTETITDVLFDQFIIQG